MGRMADDLKETIRQAAFELGFDLAGISAPRVEPRYREAYLDWIERGRQGGMGYMAQNLDKRLDPGRLVAGVRSVLCLGSSYHQEAATPDGGGRVAMYAWGRDYHRVLKDRLRRLAGWLSGMAGREVRYRAFVDSAPVLEKALAEQAGLGWIGSNGCLINRRLGSFFFLAELFADLELPVDQPAKNHCGACRRCVDACPTGAIVAPGVVDARRCISYLTIEHRDRIDPTLAGKVGPWIFGCDACQVVCPFNRFARTTRIDEFRQHRLGPRIDPAEAARWTDEQYEARTAGSAGARATLEMWRRNAGLVAGPGD